MSTIRVVNIQHTDATEPNIVLEADGTTVFASGITISGGTNLTVSGTAEFASGTVSAPSITFIDDNNTGLYEPAVDTVAITTAATERLRIDSTGNVGIGTTSPSSFNSSANQLVVGTGSAAQGLTISTGTTNNGSIYFADGTTGTDDRSGAIIYDHGGDNFRFHTAADERMRIDSSGNVGIGTTSPDSKLHVVDTNLNGIRVGYLSGTSNLNIYDADEHAFRGRGSGDKVRIDSLGNVGIGTTSPANSSGYNTLTLGNGTSIGGQLLLKNASGNNFWIWHDSNGANIYNSAATSQIFYTNSAERMRILATGGLTFNGDTAQANALDDYEEGTWSPTYSGLVGTTRRAYYTKIGKLVSMHIYFTATSRTTAMFSFSLPFTADTTTNAGTNAGIEHVGAIMMNNVTSPSNVLYATPYVWGTNCQVYYTKSNNSTWDRANGDEVGDSNIISIQYLAAS